jgi:virulence factor
MEVRVVDGNQQVRVAMIGAGRMATRVHYPSLASFEDVEIAAVCDLDPARLESVAETYGIARRYTDYRRMVEEVAPDAVYVIGPPHLMYDIWMWCLARGLNLFIEKPMGITLHQARALAYMAERHGCITQVDFQRRSCPLAVRLRDACLERGPIVHAVCRFYKSQIEPFLGAYDHMMDDGVHAIDTLRWMCGGEVVEIASAMKSVGVPDRNFIAAMLHFDTGATGLLLNSWSSGRRIFSVEMHAPGICAEADLEGMGHLYADGDTTGIAYDTRTVAGSDDFHVFGGFCAKNREFIDAVRTGTPPSSNFADAVKTMEVAERILAAAMSV